jgi:hypothetical protein
LSSFSSFALVVTSSFKPLRKRRRGTTRRKRRREVTKASFVSRIAFLRLGHVVV